MIEPFVHFVRKGRRRKEGERERDAGRHPFVPPARRRPRDGDRRGGRGGQGEVTRLPPPVRWASPPHNLARPSNRSRFDPGPVLCFDFCLLVDTCEPLRTRETPRHASFLVSSRPLPFIPLWNAHALPTPAHPSPSLASRTATRQLLTPGNASLHTSTHARVTQTPPKSDQQKKEVRGDGRRFTGRDALPAPSLSLSLALTQPSPPKPT